MYGHIDTNVDIFLLPEMSLMNPSLPFDVSR